MGSQLGLFEGLALLVGEPAKKRRESRAAEDAKAAEWCELERARVMREAKRAKRKQREPTEDSESARVVREELREALRGPLLGVAEHVPPPCPHHGPEFVCEREGLDTDHSGFVHRTLCKGRIALRWCAGCGKPTTPGRWNHRAWDRCLECAPLGTVTQ